jgi:hypothetical protein
MAKFITNHDFYISTARKFILKLSEISDEEASLLNDALAKKDLVFTDVFNPDGTQKNPYADPGPNILAAAGNVFPKIEYSIGSTGM